MLTDEPTVVAGAITPARAAITVAAIGSAAAGLVHAAAAGNHEGNSLLVWLFSGIAAAQLGWAWAVGAAGHRRREVLLAGLAINGGAFGVWALTRTIGIGLVGSLTLPEPVGLQDVVAAGFAALTVGAVLWMLARRHVAAVAPRSWTGALAACALLVALPAVAAGHQHPEGAVGHAHGAGELAAADGHDGHTLDGSTDTTAAGHDDHTAAGSATTLAGHDAHTVDTASGLELHDAHTTGTTTATTVDHDGHTSTTSTTSTTVGHGDHGGGDPGTTDPPIISLDDPRLTDAQVDAAVALIVSTRVGMFGFTSVDEVVAAGYTTLGDGGQPGQFTHFVNWSYMTDDHVLDAAYIESIVTKMNADGTIRVVAAMYSLTLGSSMDDVPEIAGALTTWHDHDNFCFDGTGFVAVAVDGACLRGAILDTPPMLHVWVEDNPCGPFGIIDELGQDCGAEHTH